jgi:mannitol 2-dehydrogenase
MQLLNNSLLNQPGTIIKVPMALKSGVSQMLHFGVGGFHRSHQAYAIQQLIESKPDEFSKWAITGVCLMPGDIQMVENLRAQDNLYSLKLSSPSGAEEVQVINAINSILHAKNDAKEIIERIADKQTKVISFTITEGGYNVDYESARFLIENPAIQSDLLNQDHPTTVFGFLAKGLALRRLNNNGSVTLMSCDNIQENGHILKLALMSFVEVYDAALLPWIEEHVLFPNSMVDRITPVTSAKDKADFEEKYGVKDNCLVVCEDYFQWVLEDNKHADFPPLEKVGVEIVSDVRPYEAMKLSILNGGHTLVGLLGDAFGYNRIHSAVVDESISSIYDIYIQEEVIPTLEAIPGVSFHDYYKKIKVRFSNAMINDSTDRIISGSSDKIPKFVLPILQEQLKKDNPKKDIALLIIVAWWLYLEKEFNKNRMADVQDQMVSQWLPLFEKAAGNWSWFIHYQPIFGTLADNPELLTTCQNYVEAIQQGEMVNLINMILVKYS